MTKAQRQADARWWRALARDYERRAKRVNSSCIGCWGLCLMTHYGVGSDANKRRFAQLRGDDVLVDFLWPEVARTTPEAFDLRATACCLIAAMVEAGDA